MTAPYERPPTTNDAEDLADRLLAAAERIHEVPRQWRTHLGIVVARLERLLDHATRSENP